jgi:hypothetical protein
MLRSGRSSSGSIRFRLMWTSWRRLQRQLPGVRTQRVRIEGAPVESIAKNEIGIRAVPFGSGWLEWRWVAKPSGRQFGPYVYYRWRGAKVGGNAQSMLERLANVAVQLRRRELDPDRI